MENAIEDNWVDYLSDFMDNYIFKIMFLQFLVAISLFGAGFQFYFLQEGARKVLQGLVWLSYSFLFFLTFLWFSFGLDRVIDKQASISDYLLSPGQIITLLINAMLVIGLIVTCRTLRSDKIKNAMIHYQISLVISGFFSYYSPL